MVNWKTKITPILIENFDSINHICVYKPENGEFVEKNRMDITELKETWIGYYKNTEKGLIGIFASDCGPVFFVNNERYLLTEGSWDFEISVIADYSHFSFWHDGKEYFNIDYLNEADIGIHPYADEEFMDFFVWLSKCKDSRTFITFYTVDKN